MKITEINIDFIKPQNGLIAFASVVIDYRIFLNCIGIHKKLGSDGYRITFPTRTHGIKKVYIHHPIRKASSKQIESAILGKLKSVLKKKYANVRHNRYEDK
ncbi:MAG: hypothetical protein GY804_14225 [Alphaproteobacteria bacterium]|nr:hypothetical protein [Alphaproteobacteria bacterium]